MDVGVEINKYRIIEHIGRGGMADVWSARDQRLNRMVAIKTIAHGLSQDVDPVGLFKQEAQTIAQMEHPHILPIYDFGEYEGQLYIVMRYVAGGSLDDLLRRGALPLSEALRLGQAIAQALDYAHSSKVIHLDLKPPNVLLDSHQSPYLADFGLATKLNPEGKAANPGSGTLLYMAPEQLTAEIIDHRADIYSFTILMFHLLTGQLPFEATIPMALKQLQFHEELPELDAINPSLPASFTDILRHGVALDPNERPNQLMDLIDELRETLIDSTSVFGFEAVHGGDGEVDPYTLATENMREDMDMAVLEAVDIYSRARHNWSGGNGRFLLGVTHFMLMNSYYMEAEFHRLEVDIPGLQMLLRGALEYDHEVDYWWGKLDDENRRWVCLHALRSGNAPARVRSLYRLETLPDAEKPQIPKLVAQALQIETNEEARLAALHVLGTRAKLMSQQQQYDIKTEYRGRMLTTMTRLGIQVLPPAEWQEVVYTPEIDLLIAETALDYGMPKVAAFAARIIGRIRSQTSVRYIARQQQEGRKGALRALALVRDEAPNLPPVVSTQGRFYAWFANTIRRMTDPPLTLIFRYFAGLIGGWLGMGFHVFTVYRQEMLFVQPRWANSIAIGLVFGLIYGFVVIFADEFSVRLRHFWPWWVRVVFGLVTGTLWGMFCWWSFVWFYLQFQPDTTVVTVGGFGMALGLVVSALFGFRSWLAIPLTAFLTYIPVYITFQVGWMGEEIGPLYFSEALLYYERAEQIFTVALPLVFLLAIGAHFPMLVQDVIGVIKYIEYRRAARRFEEARMLPAVPDVKIYALPPKQEPVMDAINLKTELDVAGFGGSAAEAKAEQESIYGQTELDVNKGIRATGEMPAVQVSEPQPIPDVNQADQPTVEAEADEERKYAQTELDVNKGLRAAQEKELQKPETGARPKSQRVNIGTGIRITDDSANLKTELDVNKRQDKGEEQ